MSAPIDDGSAPRGAAPGVSPSRAVSPDNQAATAARATRHGPLAGLQVVEMAAIGPVPLAGQLLGDLGAEVLRIDRSSAPVDVTDITARSKTSVALDLKQPAGVAAARAIIGRADILLEGFRPGVMERLGLGPEVCHADNPRLVYGRMTGWGQTGPLAASAGHDINYLALTGALAAIGRRGEPPVPPLNLIGDYAGGTMFLLFGVLAALIERQSSGRGQVVDAAMVDGVPALMGLIHAFDARGTWTATRESNLLDGGAPFYRCYTCADGRDIAVGALEPQFFKLLVTGAGLPVELAHQYDRSAWEAHREIYAHAFRQRSRDEWAAVFEGTDACVAPVLDFDEAARHPHVAARGIFGEIAGVRQAMPAPRFDRTPPPVPAPPVASGAGTEAVLAAVGYTPAQIARLRDSGVLT